MSANRVGRVHWCFCETDKVSAECVVVVKNGSFQHSLVKIYLGHIVMIRF